MEIFKGWSRSPNFFKPWSLNPTKNEDSTSLDVSIDSLSLAYITLCYSDVKGKHRHGRGRRHREVKENEEIYNLTTRNEISSLKNPETTALYHCYMTCTFTQTETVCYLHSCSRSATSELMKIP